MQIDFFFSNNGILRRTEHLQQTDKEDKELNSKHLVPSPVIFFFLNSVCNINVSVSLYCHSKIPQTGGNVNGNTERKINSKLSLVSKRGR